MAKSLIEEYKKGMRAMLTHFKEELCNSCNNCAICNTGNKFLKKRERELDKI